MNSIRSKIGLQFLVSNGSVVAHFLLSLVMARLLSPAEIGVFSITAVLVSFTQVFRDFGVVAYIKRQKKLTPEILRSATGVLFSASWTIAAALYFSTDLWAQFFGQTGIKQIMPVLALGFVFIPFGSIPQAVLSRSLEVTKTALVTALSTFVYIATCISLATLDFGYMSMAWANLAGILASAIALTLLMPKDLPLSPSFTGWRRVVQFGAGSMLTSSLKALDMALPDLVLGKLSGAHQVGIFSRGNSTVNIVNTVTSPTINYFALPLLSQAHHNGLNLGAKVGRNVALITGLVWPVLAATSVMAEKIIVLLYGEKWAESALVVPYLCLILGIQVTFGLLQQSLTAMGRPYLSAVPLGFALVFKFCLAVALFDGSIITFALAVCIGEVLTVPIYIAIAQHYALITPTQWIAALDKSFFVALLVLGCTFAASRITEEFRSEFWRLLCVLTISAATWLISVVLIRHPLRVEIFNILKRTYTGNLIVGKQSSTNLFSKMNDYRPLEVLIYGAVAEVPQRPPTARRLLNSLKLRYLIYRDLLLWKIGSTARLDYRNYITQQVVNRGDEAILMASRMLFARHATDLVFLNCNWEDHSAFGIDCSVCGPQLIAVCGSGYITIGRDGALSKRLDADLEAMTCSTAPVVLLGIGVNILLGDSSQQLPAILSQDENTLRKLFERAVLISVRDRASQQIVMRYTDKSVYLVGDPALFLSEKGRKNLALEQPLTQTRLRIGLNLPFHGPDATSRIKADLPKYVATFKAIQATTKCQFVYMVHFDAEQVIVKILQSEGLDLEVCRGSVTTLLQGYESLNIHLGGMLHSCIMASSAGTPSVALAYDMKHAGFFDLLGMHEYCVPAVPFDSDHFASTALLAVKNELSLRASIVACRLDLEAKTDMFVDQCVELIRGTPARE